MYGVSIWYEFLRYVYSHDNKASELSDRLDARAFTIGSDIDLGQVKLASFGYLRSWCEKSEEYGTPENN